MWAKVKQQLAEPAPVLAGVVATAASAAAEAASQDWDLVLSVLPWAELQELQRECFGKTKAERTQIIREMAEILLEHGELELPPPPPLGTDDDDGNTGDSTDRSDGAGATLMRQVQPHGQAACAKLSPEGSPEGGAVRGALAAAEARAERATEVQFQRA
jgi:hypothetical protein